MRTNALRSLASSTLKHGMLGALSLPFIGTPSGIHSHRNSNQVNLHPQPMNSQVHPA